MLVVDPEACIACSSSDDMMHCSPSYDVMKQQIGGYTDYHRDYNGGSPGTEYIRGLNP